MSRGKLTRRQFGVASAGAVAGVAMARGMSVRAQDATPEAAPAWVPPTGVSVYADGLYNPRYISFDENDALFISEAGDAGPDAHTAVAGEGTPESTEVLSNSGLTGQVTKIAADGTRNVLTAGLPSYSFGSEVVGPAGISYRDGKLVLAVGGPGAASFAFETLPMTNVVLSIDPASGEVTQLADILSFERDNNPDPNSLDSNLYGNAIGSDGTVYQADAGGNTVYKIDATSGELSVLAVLPGVPMPGFANPARGGNEEIDPVPTGVVAASDGNVWIAELTGGPFPPMAASIYAADAMGSLTQAATGLTMIGGIAEGPDGMIYAAQISDNLLGQTPPAPGSIVKVDPATGTVTPILTGLPMPNDVAFDSAGMMYVVAMTTVPPGTPPSGMVLKVDLSQLEPVASPVPAGTPEGGSEGTPAAGGSGNALEVEAVDLAFKPNQLTAPAGEVTVNLTNNGFLPHDLTIEGVDGADTGIINAGKTATFTVTLAAGTYTFYCSVPGHKDAGMVGSLVVS